MEKISFNMAARTAGLIGRDNVPTPYGALIELVKNAYDADANSCAVFIDYLNDTIWIADDGTGMTSDTIRTKWMIIGTNDKLTNPRSVKNRIKAGAKGIGRFSLDRLGQRCEMLTKTEGGDLLSWKVDWSAFDKKGTVLTDVRATLTTHNHLSELGDEIAQSHFGKKFVLESLKAHGTVFKIQGLRDEWNDKRIVTIQQLETLKYPHGEKTFDIYLLDSFDPVATDDFESYQVQVPYYDDYDYRLSCVYEAGRCTICLNRNELDKSKVSNRFYSNLKGNYYPYDAEGFMLDNYELDYTLNDLFQTKKDSKDSMVEYVEKHLGRTTVELFYAKRTMGGEQAKYRYRYFNSIERREWLTSYGGIKIFRDNFKVRPYGEGEMRDWLGLDARRAQNPAQVTRKGGGRFKEDQVAGAVHISRLDSERLDDVSSREGLKDDKLVAGLKRIVIALIHLIERDRHYAAVALEEEYLAHPAQTKEASLKEVREFFKGKNKKKFSKRDYTKIKNAFRQQDRKIEDLAGELSILRALAGVGAVTTSFAHDLKGLQGKIANHTLAARKRILKIVDVEEVEAKRNPLTCLDSIDRQQAKIEHWLKYITGSIKRDKRKRKHVDPVQYLQGFQTVWSELLSDKNITLNINHNFSQVAKIRAFEIDLDSIFSNLVLNSLESLKKVPSGRQIKIFIAEDSDNIIFNYSDTGGGLAEELKDPNSIFERGISTKIDVNGEKGLGLGMYLVDCTIKDNSGTVKLKVPASGFGLELCWPKVNRG